MDAQNRLILQHLEYVAKLNNLNTLITVPFVSPPSWHGPRFRFTRQDASDAYRLFGAYVKNLSKFLHKRPRELTRDPSLGLSCIAFPECVTRTKEQCHLHYHAIAYFDPAKGDELEYRSRCFWHQRGMTHFKSPIEIDVRSADNSSGLMRYILKNIDDDLTLQNMVCSGPIRLN